VPTWSDVDFWPLNTTLYAADFKGNDPKFLYHLFETLDLSGYDSGSVQPMLNRNYIASIEVRVPDPGTQRAIAEVLGALNAKIAANDLVCKTSREFMVATYDVALANGAVTQTIGEVAAIFDGPHATPRKTDTGPWFLSISSLQGGRLALAESAHLSESDFEHWTRRVTPSEGDLLFSYETRLGEAALMPSGVRGCLGRRMALLRPRAGTIGSRVLAQAFRSDSFQRTIRQRAIHGATVDRIPLVVLPSWPIEVPLNSDGQLESTLADIDERVEQADRESASLAQLRDALLPLLMSGKVRVRDVERRVEDAL
jgi:type I restriction enzyme S subunit